MDNSIFLNSRYEYFKYELLTIQDSIYKHKSWVTKYVNSAKIKIDFTRDILCSLDINMKEDLTINYLSDLIKPWYCIVINDITYEFPLGCYMLLSPKRISDSMIVTRSITGYDLLYALEQDKLTASVNYAAGTNVINTITSLLTGIGTWVTHNIEPITLTLSEPMTYEIGRSKLFVINGLLNAINYYPLFMDGNGIFRAIPWSNSYNPIWEFKDNNQSLYTKGIDVIMDYAQIYNKVILISNQLEPDTEPLISIKTFEDLSLEDHPFSYTSIGRYITQKFDSEAVSQEYLDARATRELLKMCEIEESINYKHAFITNKDNDGLPYQGDAFKFYNSLLNLNATYKIQSMDWDLSIGSLVNTVIRRVRNI